MRRFVPLAVAMAMALLFSVAAHAADTHPEGTFTDGECVACHQVHASGLVAEWSKGPHRGIGCTDCHGDRHGSAAAQARPDEGCLRCHGGKTGSLGRSHLTSKHGVIVTLNSHRWDWTRPLANADYRAPSCAYCHMHEGRHAGADPATACLDCHSPRFAETMARAAERSVAVGGLKLKEGLDAAASAPDTPGLEPLLVRLRASYAALRAGAVHHSPDIQWWDGQAALDGDLLRIKSAITGAARANPNGG